MKLVENVFLSEMGTISVQSLMIWWYRIIRQQMRILVVAEESGRKIKNDYEDK